MRDLAADFGTSIVLFTEPRVEDGCAVVDGITAEGSMVRSKFSIMQEYAVTDWA